MVNHTVHVHVGDAGYKNQNKPWIQENTFTYPVCRLYPKEYQSSTSNPISKQVYVNWLAGKVMASHLLLRFMCTPSHVPALALISFRWIFFFQTKHSKFTACNSRLIYSTWLFDCRGWPTHLHIPSWWCTRSQSHCTAATSISKYHPLIGLHLFFHHTFSRSMDSHKLSTRYAAWLWT